MGRIPMVATVLLAGLSTAAAETVTLRGGARVCDATDCYVLSSEAMAVTVWQTMADGSIQFAWGRTMVTAKTSSFERPAPRCGWAPVRGKAVYLCDGKTVAELNR